MVSTPSNYCKASFDCEALSVKIINQFDELSFHGAS